MNDRVEKLFNYVKDNYSEKDIAELIDEAVLEYVDFEQMREEDIVDEHEWYSQFGRREAEDQVEDELLAEAIGKTEIYNLNYNEVDSFYAKLRETFWFL